jgi:hypothetical protein
LRSELAKLRACSALLCSELQFNMAINLLIVIIAATIQCSLAFSLPQYNLHSNRLDRTAASSVLNISWYDAMPLDHFSFSETRTFSLRYLTNEQYWQRPSAENNWTPGPILFYTGNEGDITLFAQNTGLMWDLCPEYHCLLLFAEHRYYGATLPFGANSFDNATTLQFLTAEQALADYSILVPWYKKAMNCSSAPVISFGGSYGGMLTAWFRQKYPWVTAGGIAASAPVRQFPGLVNPDSFSKVVTKDFAEARAGDNTMNCASYINKSWDITLRTPYSNLNRIFQPCAPLKSRADIENLLWPYIGTALSYIPMADYPTAATFLGAMPANPVNVSCTYFKGSDDQSILEGINGVIALFYNSTLLANGEVTPGQGPLTCNQLANDNVATLGPATPWNYQACTEMILPQGQYGGYDPTTGAGDLFYPAPWNLSATIQSCLQQFGVAPRPNWIPTSFGGEKLAGASNIFFSNGNLDPWSRGGILHSLGDSLPAFVIQGGAHHLDLRSASPSDPESVIQCRKLERQYISAWIAGFGSPQEMEKGQSGSGLATGAIIAITAVCTAVGSFILAATLYYCKKRSTADDDYASIRA